MPELKKTDGNVVTDGGRVLGVVAKAKILKKQEVKYILQLIK